MTPKATCSHGHPWTQENTYYFGRGYRICKACGRERDRPRRLLRRTLVKIKRP
jgi:hypothetical protein